MKHPKHAKKNTRSSAATVGLLGATALVLAIGTPSTIGVAVAESAPEPEHKEVHMSTGLMDREFHLKGEWIDLGYSSIFEYQDALEAKRQEAVGIGDAAAQAYRGTITEEELAQIREYESKMTKAVSFSAFDKHDAKLGELLETIDARMPRYTYNGGGSSYSYGGGPEGVLTRSGGVNWFNGQKETWYSSRAKRHYRTSEWTLGPDGIYRDADGYVVVALPQGATGELVETSHGIGKAYDCNAGGDSIDIYTGW